MKHPACPFKQHIRWDFEYYLRTKQDELLKSPNEYDKKAGELLKSLPLNTIILQGRNSWGRLSTNQRDCANYLVKRLRQINKPLEKAIEELSKPLPF